MRQDLILPTPQGDLQWATFEGSSVTAAMLYIHGGGWCLGGIEDSATFCQALAEACHTRIYVLNYRLAPNHPYPAANEDCLAAWESMVAREADRPCFMAGDSSGGHLALVTAMACAKKALPQPRALALIYPVTTLMPDTTTPSWVGYQKRWPLSPRLMLHFIKAYLGDVPADSCLDNSPLETADETLPPTLIVSAGCDILLDQQTQLAARLPQVKQLILPEAHHIFVSRPEGELYIPQAIAAIASLLRARLGLA